MNILVVGGGGREHTLVWKIAQSPLVEKIYWAPGNAAAVGMKKVETVNIKPEDIEVLLTFAVANEIDLTVVGPEQPLVDGIADKFQKENLKIFGPKAQAAILEGSKAFAKKFMMRQHIPTALWRTFTDPKEACAYFRLMEPPMVIKADGLAAGKGVTVALNNEMGINAINQAMREGIFGEAGKKVVIEQFLEGEEVSILTFVDGKNYIIMPSSQDHKLIYDGDKGPNTGGMGAYSPAPIVTDKMQQQIEEEIIKPTINGLVECELDYRGVLYFGLIITPNGPIVLEFNCRFGDPESQVVIPRIKSDLVPIMLACIDGTLNQHALKIDPDPAVCVVLASEGYPGKYETGKVITGISRAEEEIPKSIVFHAGTKLDRGTHIVTSGGRVLGATALGKDIPSAIDRAYQVAGLINFEGKYNRTDIGKKALAHLEKGKED